MGARCRRGMLAACLAGQLAGCSWWSHEDPCVSVEEYQEAREAPEVTVPPGLDKPDATGRLNVPPAPPAQQPLSQTAACLQQPPSYFEKPLKDTPN